MPGCGGCGGCGPWDHFGLHQQGVVQSGVDPCDLCDGVQHVRGAGASD